MEYLDNRLCISHNELTSEIMTVSSLNWFRRRGQLKQVQRGGNGREALFEVDSLPDKYRAEVYRRNPDLRQVTIARSFLDQIEIDGAAHAFFVAYEFENGVHLPTERVNEYTNNASILNAFRRLLDDAHAMRMAVGAKDLNRTKFWSDKALILGRINDKLPHSLPAHPRRLQIKYNEYLRKGYEVFISRKFQNKNAANIREPEQEALIIRLLGDHRNLDNEQVADLYNFVADKMGWSQITGRAIGHLRKKYALVTAPARLGSTEFYNKRAMQVRRDRPTAPLLYWTADGWDVELYYQKTSANSKGHNVTTYGNRMTVVVVLDPFNNYPVGYAIGDHETPELIRAALQDAANHTRELFGQRFRANQFQCDHYAFKTLTPLYGVMAEKVTPARVKNAKSKVVEPYFRYLNKTYFQFAPNWSGFGVTSRKESQPNADKLNAIRHTFPDEAGCRQQIAAFMEMERAKKREDYLAGFESLSAERRLPLPDETYLLHFGETTGQKNALEGSGLKPRIKGLKRSYDCFDPRFREYAHVRWTVKYDPADTSRVLAVNEDGTLRFMLEEKYRQPMALADRQEGDSEQLARVQQFNKALEVNVIERLAIAGETTERLVLENPALRNSYAKAVLCDSCGQHKDQRNRRRKALEKPIDVEAVEVRVVQPKRRENSDKDETIFNLY